MTGGTECPCGTAGNASFRKYLSNKLAHLRPARHRESGPGLTCTVTNLGTGNPVCRLLQERDTDIQGFNCLVLQELKSFAEADELACAVFLTLTAGVFVNTPSICFSKQHHLLWPLGKIRSRDSREDTGGRAGLPGVPVLGYPANSSEGQCSALLFEHSNPPAQLPVSQHAQAADLVQ